MHNLRGIATQKNPKGTQKNPYPGSYNLIEEGCQMVLTELPNTTLPNYKVINPI